MSIGQVIKVVRELRLRKTSLLAHDFDNLTD